MIVKTYDPKKEKYVVAGHIENSVFTRTVNSFKHRLRVINGYAIQADILPELRKYAVEKISFKAAKDDIRSISFDDFYKYKIYWNKGHGEQWAIAGRYLKLETETQKAPQKVNEDKAQE